MFVSFWWRLDDSGWPFMHLRLALGVPEVVEENTFDTGTSSSNALLRSCEFTSDRARFLKTNCEARQLHGSRLQRIDGVRTSPAYNPPAAWNRTNLLSAAASGQSARRIRKHSQIPDKLAPGDIISLEAGFITLRTQPIRSDLDVLGGHVLSTAPGINILRSRYQMPRQPRLNAMQCQILRRSSSVTRTQRTSRYVRTTCTCRWLQKSTQSPSTKRGLTITDA